MERAIEILKAERDQLAADLAKIDQAISLLSAGRVTQKPNRQDAASPQARSDAWSGDEDQMLKDMWLAGATTSEISNRLASRSNSAVLARVRNLGLPTKTEMKHSARKSGFINSWNQDDIDEVVRMKNNGSDWDSISDEVDRPKGDCVKLYYIVTGETGDLAIAFPKPTSQSGDVA